MSSLSQFDDLIASKSLLKHPFYVAWSKGELTLDDMKAYAKEYFQLVRRVPAIVERVRDLAQDHKEELVDHIESNLQDEKDHIELWKRFALSLGISEEELLAHQPSQKALDAVNGLEQAAEEGTFEEAVATMYALERELPEISKTKKEGLSRFYGLESEDAHIYFDEHLEEEDHFKVWLSVDMYKGVERAVRQSLQNQNKVLDAVCDVCGMRTE